VKEGIFHGSQKAALLKEIFILTLIGYFAIDLITGRRKIKPTGLNKPLFVFTMILLVQAFNPSVYGVMSVLDDLRFWLPALAVFVLTVGYIRDEKQLNLYLNVIFWYGFLEACYGVAQRFLPIQFLVSVGADPHSYFYVMEEESRVFSTMGTQHFAFFSMMMVPLAFWKMRQTNDFAKRVFFLGAAVVFILGSAYTLVRSAWVGFLLSLVVLSIISRRKFVFVIVLAGVVLIGLFFTSGLLRERIEGLVNPTADVSVQTRLYTLKRLREAVVFRVFGYGLGTFTGSRYMAEDDPEKLIIFGRATDNFYLYLVMELGWFGIATFFWILYKIYRSGIHSYRHLKKKNLAELALAIMGTLLIIDIGRMSGPAGYYVPESWHYWFFVGILFCLPRLAGEDSQEKEGIPAPSSVSSVDFQPAASLRSRS
jgi:hypothetical protein